MSACNLTTIKSIQRRFYEGFIDLHHVTKSYAMTKLKEFLSANPTHSNHYTMIIDTCHSVSLSYKNTLHSSHECLRISGDMIDEQMNDNTMFELLYEFFQYLCVQCNQPSLQWSYHGYDASLTYFVSPKRKNDKNNVK